LNVDALLAGSGDELIFTPPSHELFTTTARDFDFNPDAECPLWRKFLEEVLPDPAVRAFAQDIMGLAQIPYTNMHKFFLFFGEGANGKSVFMDVLEAIIGTRNVCAVSLARFGERFALWPLTTCLVNLVAEIPAVDSMHTSVRIAEDKLKAVVGGDIIDIERKGKDIVKGRVTARLFFNTNTLPTFADRSQGVWRRLEIVPFTVTIPDEKQIRDLARRIIATELPGVFNYALEGLVRLLKRGRFDVPEACNALKAQHRGDCAPEVGWLDDAVVAAGADDFLANEVLYSEYQSAMRAVGHQPLSIRNLGTELLRKFPSAKRSRITTPTLGLQQRGFSGIKLRLLDALEKGAKK
jgi:P4 family phage/plasmid primase-like protien